MSEDAPNVAISIQFRQPEIMCFAASGKADGHALLMRAELLLDYSSHCGTETLVISLAGLQVYFCSQVVLPQHFNPKQIRVYSREVHKNFDNRCTPLGVHF